MKSLSQLKIFQYKTEQWIVSDRFCFALFRVFSTIWRLRKKISLATSVQLEATYDHARHPYLMEDVSRYLTKELCAQQK